MEKIETYSETEGRGFFDWNKALDELENIEKRFFLDNDLHKAKRKQVVDLKDRAGSWVTCACGNQCAAIPRSIGGKPFDINLAELGVKFVGNMINVLDEYDLCFDFRLTNPTRFRSSVTIAKWTLRMIEKRSAKLLKEMGEL